MINIKIDQNLFCTFEGWALDLRRIHQIIHSVIDKYEKLRKENYLGDRIMGLPYIFRKLHEDVYPEQQKKSTGSIGGENYWCEENKERKYHLFDLLFTFGTIRSIGSFVSLDKCEIGILYLLEYDILRAINKHPQIASELNDFCSGELTNFNCLDSIRLDDDRWKMVEEELNSWYEERLWSELDIEPQDFYCYLQYLSSLQIFGLELCQKIYPHNPFVPKSNS